MKRPALTLCVVLPLLGACNFAPRYQRPALDSGTQFKEAVHASEPRAEGWQLSEPRDATSKGEWWEIYADTALNQLEARVVVSNQNVLAAEANYRVATAMVRQAEAQLFPTLSVDPAVTRTKSSAAVLSSSGGLTGTTTTTTTPPSNAAPTTGTTTGSNASTGFSTAPRTIWSLPLQASYQVDLWGSIRNTVAQNRFSAEASAAQLANARLSMQATLAQDYFQVRIADEERRILQETLHDFDANLHLVQTLYRNGLDSEEDVAQAETQLKSAQAQATDLGVTRATYEHAIAVLIGVPPSSFSLPYAHFSRQLPAVPVSGVPADLIERRPDIAAAERQIEADNAAIGIARAAYFPQLSLSGTFGFESTSVGQLLKWPNRYWSVGPDLAQTLFDGGARRAVTAQARAQYDSAVATYRQTVLAALQGVEDNLASLRILAQEADEEHAAAVAAQHAVALSVVRFRSGVDSYVNVITAQNAFLNARETEVQVVLRQYMASVNLINNLGGGWSAGRMADDARLAEHPGLGADGRMPAGDAADVPNPPPVPASEIRPEELLQQDQDAMGSSNPPAPPR